MAQIKIELKNCKGCPHFSTSPYPTNDSWERPEYWWCNEGEKRGEEKRKIAEYVEWTDEKNMEIPNWCPLKID